LIEVTIRSMASKSIAPVEYACHAVDRKASEQGDALAIGNLGMLYVRGQGVKENKVAGVALLLVSATRDNSPANNAKKNISSTRDLTAEMVAAAQTLSAEMSSAKKLLVPLDHFLENSE
jgi:TPR repeat protein